MKKLFLLVVVAIMGTTSLFAQGSLLATLSHNGNVSVFYGTEALRKAYAAADHGDVITLSSGSFISTNITKAVSIRGAGCGIDSTITTEPTIITGDFDINIADTVANHLTLEGIYSNSSIHYVGTLKNAMFLKCRFKNISYGNLKTDFLKDASFIHCRIADGLTLNHNSSASCINSAINEPNSLGDTSNFEFINCVVRMISSGKHARSSSFKNSIINYNSQLSSNDSYYNNIGLGSPSIFSNATNSTNKFVSDISTVFKTYKGESFSKLDSERFELTEEAQTKYLGSDGTQVGIYGGSLPYDPIPTNPQITKCKVAAKSTADGKLSVDIEVRAAE